MEETESSPAMVTKDGWVTEISERAERHQAYGIDAYPARITVPLTPEQSRLANMRRDCIETSVRSWAAQAGICAGHPACTHISVGTDTATVETMIADLHGGQPLIDGIRVAMKKGQAQLMRLFLLPEESEMKPHEMELAMAEGACAFPGADMTAHDGLVLPLVPDFHYELKPNVLSTEDVVAMLLGKGRDLLESKRDQLPGLPENVPSREFFLGAVTMDAGPYIVILDRKTTRDGNETMLEQTQSHLDHWRSKGARQVELHNLNGHPEPLPVQIHCKAYKTEVD